MFFEHRRQRNNDEDTGLLDSDDEQPQPQRYQYHQQSQQHPQTAGYPPLYPALYPAAVPETHRIAPDDELWPKPATNTLYENRSVSIINCEYKFKEKYPHMVTLVFFFIIYITMILLGASLFMAFEGKAEQRLRDGILNKQRTFLQQNPCVDAKELKQFVKSIINTYDKGVNLALLNDLVEATMPLLPPPPPPPPLPLNQKSNPKNESVAIMERLTIAGTTKDVSKTMINSAEGIEQIIVTDHKERPPPSPPRPEEEGAQVVRQPYVVAVPMEMSNWEFGSSLTFVASVVTTIGYGHVTPITTEGKILTLVFGAVSIPCTLLFLSIIISMVRDGPVKRAEVWLLKLFGHFTEEVTLLKIRFLHLFLVTVVLFSALIIIPALLFHQMEPEWTILDSFYYCFITITTVGLGDFVPGQNRLSENRTWYLISIVLYMYTGLCLMMLWIALVLRIPYFNFKTFLVIEEPELLERKVPLPPPSPPSPAIQVPQNEMTPLLMTTTMAPVASTSSGCSYSSSSTDRLGSNQPEQQPEPNSSTSTSYHHHHHYQTIY